ncbi:DJ-1/PfpI family protein [Coprinopsis marcescibilis]|uniref:DJ-1/PfpI family protein n=1 Tax=Coprinopsis marcescibilis TaxID=230819 RepID=A0A5C3KQ65_COPMA|nr:DJ-1/PfpI family protein [Coprinopsis marcescibilis]
MATTTTKILELPEGSAPTDAVPVSFGLILYNGFQALDVFGPIDALNVLSLAYPIKLHIIAKSLDPVSTKTPQGFEHPGSAFSQSIVPTHTFDNAPKLDVLIIPGGLGNRPPEDVGSLLEYIRRVYPTVQYVITVCTGSYLLACTGILDGRTATTNKAGFRRVAEACPNVNWVGKARWVADGNIWTSSGVSAGLDVIFAWIEKVYGDGIAKKIANWLEYERHTDPNWDPFADLYGLK